MRSQVVSGIFFLIIWVGVLLWMGRDIKPSGLNNDGYEPCYQNGHPLWTDC